MNIKVRLAKIEEAYKPPGRVVVWFSDSGEPVPKVRPEDRLIKVLYVTPPRPNWMTPDNPQYHDPYWGPPREGES